MPRIHPIFGIVAVPLLAASVLYQQYSYSNAETHRLSQLINNLNDPDSGVRQSAVEALGMIGKPAVEPLIATLRTADSSVQRNTAEQALGKIGEPAVKPLIAALGTADSGIQRSAAEQALSKIGEPAIEQLIAQLDEANSDEVRQCVVEALGAIGKPAVEPLIAALKNAAGGNFVNHRDKDATKVFVIIGEPAVDPLIKLLKVMDTEDGWHARWSAAAALGEIKAPRAIDPLTVSARRDVDSDVRASALNAISAIKSSAWSSPVSHDTAASNPASRDKQLAVHLAKAKVLWSSGQSKEALEECDAALRLDSTNEDASSLREKYTKALNILNGTNRGVTQSISQSESLVGTTWGVTESNGDNEEFSFQAYGALHFTYQGILNTNATWKQDGDAIYVEINGKRVQYQGRISGMGMEGKVWNAAGKSWTWEAVKR